MSNLVNTYRKKLEVLIHNNNEQIWTENLVSITFDWDGGEILKRKYEA